VTDQRTPPPDDGLWDYGDPAASESRLRAHLDELADPALRMELLTQVARAQGLQGRIADAHATLDEVMEELDALPPRATMRYNLERGRLHRDAGEPERARALFAQAWEIGRRSGEGADAIDAAHMLALVAAPEEQLAWNLEALALAERTPDPRGRRWVASLCNNLGWLHHERGEFAQALGQFQRALAARERQGQPRETRIARWCVARALRSLGRAAEALAIQRQLLAEMEAAGEPDGFVEEELGELLLAEGDAAARPHFARAHELLSADPWLAAHEPGRLARLRELGAG
jgi:tetratricopeptide (TPR) repeat protein